MKIRDWISWACIIAAISAIGADQNSRRQQQDAWTNSTSNTAVAADLNAVAELAAALMNMTMADSQTTSAAKPQTGLRRQPGRLMVKFKEFYGSNYSAVAQLVNDWAGIDLIEVLPGTGIAIVNVSSSHSDQKMAASLADSELVDSAEMDYLMSGDGNAAHIPANLLRMQVGEVWRQYTAGDCGVVVCHIDSGTHWNSNNWYNAGEYGGIPLVDDDGNGVVDDFWGANFLDSQHSNNSWDSAGHGTDTSCVLGCPNDGNSATGLGIAPKVAIMPCKTMANDLDVPFSAAIQCIEWCKTNFENIASMGGRQKTGIYTTAWGSNSASDGSTLSAVIRKVDSRLFTILKSCLNPALTLWEKLLLVPDSTGRTRALFTSSAGNEQTSNHVPASLGLPNIVSLTYCDSSDVIQGNKGPWVDVAMSVGSTSDAAGAGGGLAALMVAANPALTPEQMKAAMIAGVDTIAGMEGQLVSNGRSNALKAFQYLDGQGLVQKATTTPDLSQQCNPFQVWSPPYPEGRVACAVPGRAQCWNAYASQN